MQALSFQLSSVPSVETPSVRTTTPSSFFARLVSVAGESKDRLCIEPSMRLDLFGAGCPPAETQVIFAPSNACLHWVLASCASEDLAARQTSRQDASP